MNHEQKKIHTDKTILIYSKASRYTAWRSADLGDTRFLPRNIYIYQIPDILIRSAVVFIVSNRLLFRYFRNLDGKGHTIQFSEKETRTVIFMFAQGVYY